MKALSALLVGLALSLTGCGSAGASVPWEDYSPAVKQRIDGLVANKDCTGLQEEFDNADANNEATMSRTGHNNADLMAYLDEQMQAAGCY